MSTMKRSRELVEDRDDQVEALAMANCSMLLSRIGPAVNLDGRVFECKSCNKKFPSSQALGGHRARHKFLPPTLTTKVDQKDDFFQKPTNKYSVPMKDDHAYGSICGLKFAARQALVGGHMKRHRGGDGTDTNRREEENNMDIPLRNVPILKRSTSSSKRVLCLDLNLTPYENDLMIRGYQIRMSFI